MVNDWVGILCGDSILMADNSQKDKKNVENTIDPIFDPIVVPQKPEKPEEFKPGIIDVDTQKAKIELRRLLGRNLDSCVSFLKSMDTRVPPISDRQLKITCTKLERILDE